MGVFDRFYEEVAGAVQKLALKARIVILEAELQVTKDRLDESIVEKAALNGKVANLERLLEETSIHRDRLEDACQAESARVITLERGIREALKLGEDKDLAFFQLRELIGE